MTLSPETIAAIEVLLASYEAGNKILPAVRPEDVNVTFDPETSRLSVTFPRPLSSE